MLSATPSARQMVQNLVQEVLTWQKRNETQHLPKRYGVDDEQRKLGIRFAKLLLRRDKGLGTHPREAQLSPAEVALVNSVPGVPLRGCSMQATPSNAYSGFEEPGANTAHVATDIVSSGGDSGAEQPSAAVCKKVDDLIAFVTLSRGVLPRKRSDEPCEASLANAYRDLKSRCNGPIRSGKSPSELKLTPSEVAYFNQIEEARNHGGASESPGMHRSSVRDNAEVERQMHELVIAKDYQGAALVEEIRYAPLADVEAELIDPALAASSSASGLQLSAASSGWSPVEESVSARGLTASDHCRPPKRATGHLFPVAPSKRVVEVPRGQSG